jgi:aerobic-type carbon monoxide dehydrogenase small subunit (CoxS/CutS family)
MEEETPMPSVLELTVNGAPAPVATDAATPLLAVLRDELGLTGSKISCGEGACGACTVLVDGAAVRSCVTPVGSVVGKAILTIEGLARDDRLHPLQQAFLDQQAFQCGYCTPGMIMVGVALLARWPRPREDEIVAFMQGNICRCGVYGRIIRAIRQAAAARAALGAEDGE